MCRLSLVKFKPFIFPHRPSCENSIQDTEDPVKRRLVVLPIVIDPSFKNGITNTGQVFKTFVTAPVKTPASHLMTHLLSSFTTHRRAETNKASLVLILRCSWSKQIPEKHKCFVWIIASPVIILAIDNLRLFRMKFQLALKQPLFNLRLDPFGLLLTATVRNYIVGVALKRNSWIVAFHPLVKSIVEKKIRQQWTTDAPLGRSLVSIHKCSLCLLGGGLKLSLNI
jgi:hypothetical protein